MIPPVTDGSNGNSTSPVSLSSRTAYRPRPTQTRMVPDTVYTGRPENAISARGSMLHKSIQPPLLSEDPAKYLVDRF